MINKILCILLLLLFIILLIKLYEKINIYKTQNTNKTLKLYDTLNNNNFDNINTDNIYNNIEHFEQNAWITDKNVLNAEKQPLNEIQKDEVKNMINQLGKEQLKTLIAQQSPLLTGPSGPPGPQGPAGTTLVSSGRLVNKVGSFSKNNNDKDKNKKINDFYPEFVVSRTEGTNAASSLCFMDKISPFTSYQNWELNVNNQIRNRYDNNCLTMDNKNDKVYISQCGDNPNQKWTWDNSNRIISTTNSSPNKLKCIGLSKPEINMLTTNVPGCKDNSCSNNVEREFMIVKDCDVNNINKDEIWSFV
jgi:hypothetical protein